MTNDTDDQPLASGLPGQIVRDLRGRLDGGRRADDDELDLRLDLARALFSQARHAEAARELQTLIADGAFGDERRVAAQALLAASLAYLGRSAEARSIGETVVGSPLADGEAQVLARSALRALSFFEGRFEDALEQARVIVEIASVGGAVARGEARLDMAGMLYHADRFEEAARWYQVPPEMPERQRLEAAEHLAAMNLARGQWRAVLDGLVLVAAPDDPDRPDLTRVIRPALRAHALIHLDRLEQAHRELGRTMLNVASTATLVALALLAEADSDLATAGAIAERAVALVMETNYRPQLRIYGPEVVRLALAAGDAATAKRAAAGLEEATRVTAVGSVHGAALLARGTIARDPQVLTAAIAALATGPRVVMLAQAHEALAAVLLNHDRSADAVAALRRALAMWESLEAVRDYRRVSQVLAGLGVRTRPKRRSVDALGWTALSPTEATVASLIGEGLTNAQIADRLVVSPRTVESHVAHVLSKLDLPSRSAVARLVAERQR